MIARVKYKSRPQKKLCAIYEDKLCKEDRKKMTSKVKDKSGKIKGFILISPD